MALIITSCIVVGYVVDDVVTHTRKRLRTEEYTRMNSLPLARYPGSLTVPRVMTVFTDGTEEVTRNKANNPDWEFRIYNETTGLAFMETNCAEHALAFKQAEFIAYKADIFRLCALWHHAGAYADDDLLFTRPLTEVLGTPSTEVFLVRDRPSYDFWGKATHRGVWQGLLAVVRPHHRFFKCSLNAARHNVLAGTHREGAEPHLGVTGPQAIIGCALRDVYGDDVLPDVGFYYFVKSCDNGCLNAQFQRHDNAHPFIHEAFGTQHREPHYWHHDSAR